MYECFLYERAYNLVKSSNDKS